MDELIVAIGVDDEFLNSEEFGESKSFMLYTITPTSQQFLRMIKNTSKEERFHADPKKAESIVKLLKEVNVVVGVAMGKNIYRMRERFLPIISRYKKLGEVLPILSERFDAILRAYMSTSKETYFIRKD